MKFKINENHAGVMTLKDGSNVNYGVIRVSENLGKMVYYTGKGLREMFKPDMSEEEKQRAAELKKLSENELMKQGFVAEIALSEIHQMS